MGSGVDKEALVKTGHEVLMDEADIRDVLLPLEAVGYDLVPANSALTGAEVALLDEIAREIRLKKALEPLIPRYDYILVDCPPSLNMLTVNALVAADSVIIPMQCEYYALEGLTALMKTIEKIRQLLNPKLQVEGLLRTMYDPRNNLANEVSAQLKQHFGDKVYQTVIPRNVRLAEAPSFGMPALMYDKSCAGALAYLALAGEMLRRHQQPLAAPAGA
jgi:chromosome partitioning protein